MSSLPSTRAPSKSLTLDDFDLEGIISGLQSGLFSSEELIKTYIARIQNVNDRVRAVACLNPEAIELAIDLDSKRSCGQVLGPLHGVPLLIKDIFATRGSMATTGGSMALLGAKFRVEATVIKKLRDAGAILLGKTNLSEWGMARSQNCSNGWSKLFGQALGGFHGKQDPQGSSSGSAIAASMNLAAGSIGCETCGSIIYPSQRNGVVGLKPTWGLISRAGSIPINRWQDSVGPITRYVKDAAILLDVIAGKDSADSATEGIPFDKLPQYASACSDNALGGVRIVVPKSAFNLPDPEVISGLKMAITKVRSLGATVVEDAEFSTWRPSNGMREDLFDNVALREGYESFFDSLEENPYDIRTVSDLIEFLKRTPEEEHATLGSGGFDSARDEKYSSKDQEFLAAKEKMEWLGADIAELLDREHCDVLMAPSSFDLPVDLGGNPAINIPLGHYSKERQVVHNSNELVTKGPNVPFGLTFTGRRFSEEKLLGYAYAFEQSTMVVRNNKEMLLIQPMADLGDNLHHVELKL